MKIPSIYEIKDLFFDEETTKKFITKNKINYQKMNCAKCQIEMEKNEEKYLFRCTNWKCQTTKSILANTFFSNVKIPLNKCMFLAYLWLRKTTTIESAETLQISKNSVTKYFQYFRELVSSMIQSENIKIGGKDIIVEIDETKLARRKYNRGHRVGDVWVLVGVERTNERRVFIKVLDNRSAETLNRLIDENVELGSIVYTDMWKGYSQVHDTLGFEHGTVNHSKCFKDKVTGVHTNTVEGTNFAIKSKINRWCRTTKHVDSHLTEFIWRRQNNNRLWDALIDALREIHYD